MTSKNRNYQRSAKRNASLGHKMEEMSSEVYALRRKVMECIYTIKKHYPAIPRQVVRIVSPDDEVIKSHQRFIMAYAGQGCNYVHVSTKYVNDPRLLQLVAHELVHSVTGFAHDENCPLMASKIGPKMTEARVIEVLAKYLKKYSR